MQIVVVRFEPFTLSSVIESITLNLTLAARPLILLVMCVFACFSLVLALLWLFLSLCFPTIAKNK